VLVKAAAQLQLRLLDVQGVDATLDRLAHRRRTLPELAEIERLAGELDHVELAVTTDETEDRDLGREQTKLENEVELVRGRMQRDQGRLDAGSVGSPKELESLQSEIGSLHRRQGDLEDQVLEVMERREQVQQRLAEHRATVDRLRAELTTTERRRDEALAEIDAETEKATRQRAELVVGLPDDLLALYERIRQSSSGVGAAALHRGRCEGCHLQLTTVGLSQLREAAPDEVLRCEECRRILVRTPESGL
jgi:predicted  nucleic acid-binding Zn-ribbon protein